MATPPTVSDFRTSNFVDTNANESTASLAWSAGDVVVVVGITEDNGITLGVPAVTGLTFSAVSGGTTNTASNCKCYVWSATAAGSGSGVITSVTTGSTRNAGIAAFAYTGSDGIGNVQLMASTTTTNATQSLTRGFDNSAVVCAFGDWTPVNDTTVTTTPASGGTVRVIQFSSGAYNAYVGSWTDQGAAGATAYGIANYTATPKWIGVVVEINGAAGGAATKAPIFRRPSLRFVRGR